MTGKNKKENKVDKGSKKSEEKKITLKFFKIKKGIPEYIYKGFKNELKVKDDTQFDFKELTKKYDDFMNKKI